MAESETQPMQTSGVEKTTPVIDVEMIQTPDTTNGNEMKETSKRKLTSFVWEHFTKQKINGKMKAVCKYCGSKLGGESKNGTSHLRDHYYGCFKRKQTDIRENFKQPILNSSKKNDGKMILGTYTFDQESARESLARMIVLHEYPIAMAEHYGFREYSNRLQPLFKPVSRHTIKKEIFRIYESEKTKTMELLAKNRSRIAITTDMWTASNQKRGFMVVTAHFIDDSWNLQSRVVRFIYVPCPHTSEALSNALMDCLLEWNIDRKLSTLTVDNCSTNDAMIDILMESIDPKDLLLGGAVFHVRCSAHILNLIVKDGLDVISAGIEKVRDSVAYWTATPKREEKFVDAARQLNIESTKKLALDCKTRWNSTYLMLHTALIYKDVFARLKKNRGETQYKCLPTEDDWLLAKEICGRLELFYEVTELFSGTQYPTVNHFFPKICEIRASLLEWNLSVYKEIGDMATKMITKFEKYWRSLHGIMAVGNILDPRFKMKGIEFYFPLIYENGAEREIAKVRKLCFDLLEEYQVNEKSNVEAHLRVGSSTASTSQLQGAFGKTRLINKFDLFVSTTSTTQHAKSELDYYLEEAVLPRTDDFDLLAWWKSNGIKYPTLLAIARDILAIPVSTVASESAFSTSGRFVTPHRSRLLPKTLEVLMCAQNWLWSEIKVLDTQCGKGLNTEDMDVDEENEVLEMPKA